MKKELHLLGERISLFAYKGGSKHAESKWFDCGTLETPW